MLRRRAGRQSHQPGLVHARMLAPVAVALVDVVERQDDAARSHGVGGHDELLRVAKRRRGMPCGDRDAVDAEAHVPVAVQSHQVARRRVDLLVRQGDGPPETDLPRQALAAPALVFPCEVRRRPILEFRRVRTAEARLADTRRAPDVAEVVVEAAWPWCLPPCEHREPSHACGLVWQGEGSRHLVLEPPVVVERVVQEVEYGPPLCATGPVVGRVQLHPDRGKQRRAEIEDVQPPTLVRAGDVGLGQERARPRDRNLGPDRWRVEQGSIRVALDRGLAKQPVARVGVVVGPEQHLLPSPVALQFRRLGLQPPPVGQRAVHGAIGRQWAFPVLLEREQAVGGLLGDRVAEEHPCVFDEDLPRARVGCPRLPAQDRLVHIVVDAIRVADEAVGMRSDAVVEVCVEDGARVDGLAAEREVERRIPVGHDVLRADGVGDVRVVAQPIARVQSSAGLGERRAARSCDEAAEPRPRRVVDLRVEPVDLRRREPLEREPDLRARMMALHASRQILEVGEDPAGRVVPRVAAGHEDRVEPGHLRKEGLERVERLRALGRVGQVEVGRRPDPVVEVVLRAHATDGHVHLVARQGEVGTHARVLQRDVLDAVDAEEHEVTDVPVVPCLVPGVVGVRVLAIPELVTANRVSRRRRDIERARHAAQGPLPRLRRPTQLAQEVPDAEQGPPAIGADHPDHRPAAGPVHLQAEALGPRRRAIECWQGRDAAPGRRIGRARRAGPTLRGDDDGDGRGGGPRRADGETGPEPGLEFLLQHAGRRLLPGRPGVRTNDDRRGREIDEIGRGRRRGHRQQRRHREHGRQAESWKSHGRILPLALLEQRRVEPASRQECIMRALFDDAALVEHEDLVGAPDRGKAMRDHECRAVRQQAGERIEDQRFRLGVEPGGRLVEHHDGRVPDHRARDSDPLALPTRQRRPALADDRVVPLGQGLDERVGVRLRRGGDDVVAGRLRAAVGDVLPDGRMEQLRLLQHEGDVLAEGAGRHLADVDAVDEHLAAGGVVEPGNQARQRALAAAAAADQADHLPWRGRERDVVEHGSSWHVGERHVTELHAPLDPRQHARVGGALEPLVRGEHLAHALEADRRLRHLRARARQGLNGREEPREIREEHDEGASGHLASKDEPGAEPEHGGRARGHQHGDHRRQQRPDPSCAQPRLDALEALGIEALTFEGALREDLDHANGRQALLDDRHDLALTPAHVVGRGAHEMAQPVDEQREQRGHRQRDQREVPVQREHHDEHADDGQHVNHHRHQGLRGEVLHGAHVIGDGADERPDLPPLVERQREALQVRVERLTQVVRDPLADAGRGVCARIPRRRLHERDADRGRHRRVEHRQRVAAAHQSAERGWEGYAAQHRVEHHLQRPGRRETRHCLHHERQRDKHQRPAIGRNQLYQESPGLARGFGGHRGSTWPSRNARATSAGGCRSASTR